MNKLFISSTKSSIPSVVHISTLVAQSVVAVRLSLHSKVGAQAFLVTVTNVLELECVKHPDAVVANLFCPMAGVRVPS